jgi:hypothetical protein
MLNNSKYPIDPPPPLLLAAVTAVISDVVLLADTGSLVADKMLAIAVMLPTVCVLSVICLVMLWALFNEAILQVTVPAILLHPAPALTKLVVFGRVKLSMTFCAELGSALSAVKV